MRTILFVLAIIFFIACSQKEEIFKSDIASGPTPWSSSLGGVPHDKFSFAIISDLNGGEREGIFEVAVEQINLMSPQFVLSIGDLIDGGTEDTLELKKQFDSFDNRAGKLKSTFFHVGGNHDITNKVMRKFWEQRYGKRYYHFMYNNVLFLMVDSEDYTEDRMREIYEARAKAIEVLDGPTPELAKEMDYYKMPERVSGTVGDDQSAYFENVIKQYPNVRWTFILMHKPVWQRTEERNLSRLENALAGRKYSVINGHFHDYSYTLKNEHDYMILGTTGGAQNAESENSFDHFMWITMDSSGPSIANLRLGGILDKTGKIPLNGEQYCFQASKCKEEAK